jgi:hypothetical protein
MLKMTFNPRPFTVMLKLTFLRARTYPAKLKLTLFFTATHTSHTETFFLTIPVISIMPHHLPILSQLVPDSFSSCYRSPEARKKFVRVISA